MLIIYGLFDNYGELRYVGKTARSCVQRLCEHVQPSGLIGKNHKNNWIKQLLRHGVNPVIKIIQSLGAPATEADLGAAEIYWIKYFRDQGCRLTNETDGGDGLTGHIPSMETRAKISAAKRGVACSALANEKNRLGHLGKKASAATRAKLSASQTGKRHPHTEETKNLLRSISHKVRKPHTEEAKRNMSTAALARWAARTEA